MSGMFQSIDSPVARAVPAPGEAFKSPSSLPPAGVVLRIAPLAGAATRPKAVKKGTTTPG